MGAYSCLVRSLIVLRQGWWVELLWQENAPGNSSRVLLCFSRARSWFVHDTAYFKLAVVPFFYQFTSQQSHNCNSLVHCFVPTYNSCNIYYECKWWHLYESSCQRANPSCCGPFQYSQIQMETGLRGWIEAVCVLLSWSAIQPLYVSVCGRKLMRNPADWPGRCALTQSVAVEDRLENAREVNLTDISTILASRWTELLPAKLDF